MRRWLARVPPVLSRWWWPPATLLCALALVSPSLGVGWMGDDYMQMARVDPRLHVPGFSHASLDLFTFVSGDSSQRRLLVEEGVFGWWMAPDFRMSFWRPLSSLTHVVDQWLWPHSAVLAHAQSMAWLAALLAVVAGLYRRLHVPWIAHLALLLYAVDDARAWPVGWVANRNALVAATFAFAALLVYDRSRRDGWRAGRWLGPLLFAAALLGGEAALALAGYLLAYALFLDTGPPARRLARLSPYAVLAVAWLVVYKLLGYGTTGGGMYLNPLDEPGLYLRALVERFPVLLAAQIGLSVADAWLLLPTAARVVAYALAVLAIGGFAALLAPVWRRVPACRFWAVGTLLSLPPVCATFPMDRLLVFAGVGAMPLVALVVAEWIEGSASAALPRGRRILVGSAVALLVTVHLVLAPLALPARVLAVGWMARMGGTLEGSIPAGDAIRGKTVVILSSMAELTTFPPWMQRQVTGVPAPHRMRLLATCFAPLDVSRVDATTLRLRPHQGFLDNELLRMARGLSRPFRAGDEITLSDLRVRVRETTLDGRPLEADFAFSVPLEDPSLVWTRLRGGGSLVPWSPPAVGESQTLKSVVPRR